MKRGGRRLSLFAHAGSFSIVRLGPRARIPRWARTGALHSVTRTPWELSIVCLSRHAPPSVRREDGLRCLEVVGPLPFEASGILASIVSPLARAGVPILAISTYDTDLLFVRRERFDDAISALRRAGHRIVRGRRTE